MKPLKTIAKEIGGIAGSLALFVLLYALFPSVMNGFTRFIETIVGAVL